MVIDLDKLSTELVVLGELCKRCRFGRQLPNGVYVGGSMRCEGNVIQGSGRGLRCIMFDAKGDEDGG